MQMYELSLLVPGTSLVDFFSQKRHRVLPAVWAPRNCPTDISNEKGTLHCPLSPTLAKGLGVEGTLIPGPEECSCCLCLKRGNRELLSSSPWYPVIRRGNGSKLSWGDSDWTLRSTCFLRGWSNTAIGFLGRWLMPHPWQCLRGVGEWLNKII